MKLHYRILSINNAQATIEVRFFTDTITEDMLRSDPADKENPPQRCSTDVNIGLWKLDPSDADIHAAIIAQAPTRIFQFQEMMMAKGPAKIDGGLVGKAFVRNVLDSGEVEAE